MHEADHPPSHRNSTKDDPSAPITSGFFTCEKGCKTTTTFGFSEIKYVISGSFVVSDSTGRRFTCRVGDIFYIPKGATITFETEEGGKAFYVRVVRERGPWMCC